MNIAEEFVELLKLIGDRKDISVRFWKYPADETIIGEVTLWQKQPTPESVIQGKDDSLRHQGHVRIEIKKGHDELGRQIHFLRKAIENTIEELGIEKK